MLKSRKVAGFPGRGGGRARLALRQIFLILVLLCLGLVTVNFLCNHPFEIDIVSDAAPPPSPPPALSKESDGEDFQEQIGGYLGVGAESTAGSRVGQGVGGLGSPAGEHPGSPLLTLARSKARYFAQTYRGTQRKGGRRSRKDKEKSRVLHEQHHRKIAETWANLLIKTSFSANVTDVCSPRYFGELNGGGDASVAASSETMSQVRTCVRAVICTLAPWDRDQMQHSPVSSVVSDRTNINANILEFQDVIHEELSHVLDEEMLHYARAIFLAQRDREREREEKRVAANANANAKAEPSPAEPRSEYDAVQKHALKSWVHRDSAASTKKSKEYQGILDQSKPFFRACKVGIPLLTHKQLFEDQALGAGETIGEGALRFVNFTTFGKVGSIQHSVRFPSEIFELIPDLDEQWGYQTCAVVGNNAVNAKRSAGLGAKIDSNEAVIRLNHAPFHGYENLVGSKATFDVVSTDHVRDLVMGKKVPARIRLEASKMIVTEAHTPNVTQLSLEILEQFSPKSFYRIETLLLSPQFSRYTEDLWENLWDDLESVGFISRSVDVDRTRPTPEFIAVLFALQVCDHVHLYGFRSTPTPRTYWNMDLESSYSFFHVKVSAILIKHMAIWPNSDAYRAITLHK